MKCQHNLVERTERKGFNVWYDKYIDVGENWQDEIESHINTCAAFVVIQTPRSKVSQWMRNELHTAMDMEKPLFPILLEGDIWFEVKHIQALDLRPTEKNPELRFPPKEFYAGLRKSAPGAWDRLLTDEERETTRIRYTNRSTEPSTLHKTETDISPHNPIYKKITEWQAIEKEYTNDYFSMAMLSLALIEEGSNASRRDAIQRLRKAIKLEPRIKEQDWMKCQHGWGEEENNMLEQILTDPDFWDYSF